LDKRKHYPLSTIRNRRRYIPEIKTGNAREQQQAERIAINAPIQGSAADQTKKAMLALAKKQDEETRFIVMKHGEDVAGFVIDRLTMALRLKKSDIGPAPDTVDGDNTIIDGVGKRENNILTILKVDKLLERDF